MGEYERGFKAGQDAMRPMLYAAAKRILVLTTNSHEENSKCICSSCELYRTLQKEGKAQ